MRVQYFMNEKFEVNNISAIMHHELIKSNSKDIMLHKIYISSKFVLLNSIHQGKKYITISTLISTTAFNINNKTF